MERLRLRLLDLTGRNRLINFRHSPGRSLQFVDSSLGEVFKRLTADGAPKISIEPLPEPNPAEWVERDGRKVRPEARDHARKHGIRTTYEMPRPEAGPGTALGQGSKLRTLFYAEDLGRHCRKLEREARLAVEETGLNMLYLVFGFLEYPESQSGEKAFLAPLLSVPVGLSKSEQGKWTQFFIASTGEDISDNLSLREKVKRDHSINLPLLDEQTQGDAEAFLSQVQKAVSTRPGWQVHRWISLALLSFANESLLEDLNSKNWPPGEDGQSTLLTHPIIRQVFEGDPLGGPIRYAPEHPIDDHPKVDLPLVYDADSSQHSALIDILEGCNCVIEGPPGTGKSQTITNLIAASISEGKKVLFVAEKLAALQVVKTRLSQAGLERFVLELHSNKTNKKRVIADIADRMNMHVETGQDLDPLLEQLKSKRRALLRYAEILSSKEGNALDLSLHQVMWRAELNRLRCDGHEESVRSLTYARAPSCSYAEYSDLRDRLEHLSEHFLAVGTYGPGHPFWGFEPRGLRPGDELKIEDTLRRGASAFLAFSETVARLAANLGGAKLRMSQSSAEALLRALGRISANSGQNLDFAMLPVFFGTDDPDGAQALSVLADIAGRQSELARLDQTVTQALTCTPEEAAALAPQAAALSRTAQAWGLSNKTLEQLAALRDECTRAMERTKRGVAELEELSDQADVYPEPTVGAIRRLEVLCQLAINAPIDLFHLRHPGLDEPRATNYLKLAIDQLKELRHQRARLEDRFYLDALPEAHHFIAAIATLREGDAWYRFAQGRWRRAVRFHRQLSRDKGKKAALTRLYELEALLALLRAEGKWRATPEYARIAGHHWADEDTPLQDLLDVAEWASQSRTQLESHEIPSQHFNPMTIDSGRVRRLRRMADRVSQLAHDVEAVAQTVVREFSNANEELSHELKSPNLATRIAALDKARQTLEDLLGALKSRARPDIKLGKSLEAISNAPTALQMRADLDNYEPGRLALRDRFAGARTNVAALLKVHEYGVQIRGERLPPAIEKRLLSEDAPSALARISDAVKGIVAGWAAHAEFVQAMASLGPFSVDAWAGGIAVTDPEHVRAIADRTRTALESMSRLMPWVHYVGAREEAVHVGLEPFLLPMEQGSLQPKTLAFAFSYRFYASIVEVAFHRNQELAVFRGLTHTAIREEFSRLDREIIKRRGLAVAQACAKRANPPPGRGGARVDEKTDMALLQHLIPQQQPRVPLRKLLSRAGKAVQELKPCFMMGPHAVAKFLEPGKLRFDLIVMDEASQLRPEEALGAIARGSQVVVVGDPKQLPPTSFFMRSGAAESDEESAAQYAAADMESILDVCLSHFQPVRMLRWHYRSRHESLIAFSNHHFYDNRLLVFPSPHPRSRALGVRYHYVPDGVYQNQMNEPEARRVVDAVVEHILNRPDDSLGVVTLNIRQRDLVAEMLEARLRDLPEGKSYRENWERQGMDLFVKNLENVQGDERDCIIISTTFGKGPGMSAPRQNFGPISREGGWRRLNVLFTRARKSIAVFSSMLPEHIVADAHTPRGTRALRDYLEYARSGMVAPDEPGDPPNFESEFEESVALVLARHGYAVMPQLGVAGFRIDLAVRHPKAPFGYLAAIECDGASYHSGVSVRDRDRIRQEILEGLGWKGRIWRIWSTDWFRNPAGETKRLLSFLDRLRDEALPKEFSDVDIPVAAAEGTGAVASGALSHDMGSEPDRADGSASEDIEELILRDDDEELEVEVGDLVTYAPTAQIDEKRVVRITSDKTNVEMGLISEATPLAQVLLGATVGDTVVLRVPGRAPQDFVVLAVKRALTPHADTV